MPEHMKDDEMLTLDRELSQLLAIEPSSDFAAKVRARIERQPSRTNGWHLWWLAPLAAAIVLIAIVTIARKPANHTFGSAGVQAGRSEPTFGSAGVQAGRREPTFGSAGVQAGRREPTFGSAGLQAGRTGAAVHLWPPSATPPSQTTRAVRASGPEVLIDPSVARAIRRLAMERPILTEMPPEPSLDPVVIEPLRVPDVSEIGNVRSQADQGRR